MATYYAKRALEILREEGMSELVKSIKKLYRKKKLYRNIRKENLKNNTDLPKIIQITPKKIGYKLTLSHTLFPVIDSHTEKSRSAKNTIVGVVRGGWDREKINWRDYYFHESLLNHFENGMEWERTEFYKKYEDEIEKNSVGPNYVSTFEEFRQRLNDIDRLFMSMEKNGYLSESELINNKEKQMMEEKSASKVRIRGKNFPEEPRLGIGRNGEIIRLSGGRHRISIAKILDLKSMNGLLVVRHKNWQKLREEIQNNGLPEGREELRDHPDLQDVLD